MQRFEGKTVIVTGAASGIGRASALRLAAEGAAVLLFDRDEVGVVSTTNEIVALGGRAVPFALDLTI